MVDSGPDKDALADLFSSISSTFDAAGGLFAHFGSLLVDRARLNQGDHVLDLASGIGASFVPAAQRVGPAGRVVGLDLAPGMVAKLRVVIDERGLVNAEALVGDAERLPFETETFDVVLCGFGLFFFPDTRRALAEARRVLRPGGTLALSTFTREGSDSMDRTWARIGAYMAVPVPAVRVRRFDEPGHLLDALAEAGFVDIDVERSPFEVILADVDAWLTWLRSMEFSEYLARMGSDTLEDFRQSAVTDFSRQAGGSPEVSFRMDALLTIARNP
jgi:ubiquinone/menaquinone biosynthesis C-methylase UbiE